MDLKRQPYMLRDERQKSMVMDRKIKELEEKAQKQSKQVRQLMLGGNTLRYSQNNQHHSPATRNEIEQLQNKTQTARKRPLGQDILKYSGRKNTLLSTQDPTKKGWEPPPVVNLPPRPQEKLEDKQMQYLKSQEYKKYLQKLLGADTKEDKVKYMKQNRNHNIYLGNQGGQKRDYIQAMLKSKQVLPRAHHNYAYERYPYPQRQMVSQSYRRSISPLNSYRREKISRYQYEQVKQLPKENCFFESPIKEAKQLYQGDLTKKQISQNCTLILSPVCIKKASKLQQQPKKIQKHEKHALENKRQQKKKVKQFDISQKQNTKPTIQRAQKVQKKSNFTDHKISWERQTLKNNQISAKMLIYQKEIQFNDKKVKSIEKDEKGEKQYKKSKKLQTCRYKIIPQQQSLSEKSKSQEKYYENSSSYQSDTKSPSKNRKDIYNISFKLDKPNKISQKRFGQVSKKHPSYQQKSPFKVKNIQSHRAQPYNYYEKQHNIDYRRYEQKRKRIDTQVFYEQNIPYNYFYTQQEVGLKYSQTKSATTIQTDKYQNSKSPRKISIISKSKMK